MADIEKTYLDMAGLTTYDGKIKEYIGEHTSTTPTYSNETLIFPENGPTVSNTTLVFD